MATVTMPERAASSLDDSDLYEVVNGVVVLPRQGTPGPNEDDPCYEVVRGARVEPPPMAISAATVAFELGHHLALHTKAQSIGRVQVEMLFLIDEADNTRRRPDVSFVSFDRWPRETRVPRGAAWRVAPDLAVEVVSPNDLAEDALLKIRDYFDAGVRSVWVVYPELRVIHIFDSFTSIRVLSGEDALDGGAIVPGFRLPLASLFEDLGDPE